MARNSRNQSRPDSRSDNRKGRFDKKQGNKPRSGNRPFDKSGFSKDSGEVSSRYPPRESSGRPAPRSFRKTGKSASRFESKRPSSDDGRSRYPRKGDDARGDGPEKGRGSPKTPPI